MPDKETPRQKPQNVNYGEAARRRPAIPVGPPLKLLEFPGCRAFHLSREALKRFEGRLEFWDAGAGMGWVCEPTSPDHERPGQLLARMVTQIANVRGKPIQCHGTMDLMLYDEEGEPRRLLQADQVVYLEPMAAQLVGEAALAVGRHMLPDVVLEVDHTTNVRRGKLSVYEAWGFPEVWVEVPRSRPRSRPHGVKSGLTIHLLREGAYVPATHSEAFPGLAASDIHEFMNEPETSERTYAIWRRVGETLGAGSGTGPDHNPLMRELRRESREEGHAQGREEGLAEGRHAARVEAIAAAVRQILASRGVQVSAGFPANVRGFGELPQQTLFDAALACQDERDFRARVEASSP